MLLLRGAPARVICIAWLKLVPVGSGDNRLGAFLRCAAVIATLTAAATLALLQSSAVRHAREHKGVDRLTACSRGWGIFLYECAYLSGAGCCCMGL